MTHKGQEPQTHRLEKQSCDQESCTVQTGWENDGGKNEEVTLTRREGSGGVGAWLDS